MWEKLRRVLLSREATGGGEPAPEQLRLAVAALLVEMVRADFNRCDQQDHASCRLLADYFGITEADAALLVREAEAAVDRSVSLRDFTAPLHQALAEPEKQRVILMLWRVALADRQLDRHEEHLVTKLAELLYVPRRDVLRLRDLAQSERARDAQSA
jgi:uncharacterized tellurite resistance protein B-like protein